MPDNKDGIKNSNIESITNVTGSLDRRRLLQLAGAGLVGTVAAASGVGANEDSYSNTIVFEGTDSSESSYEFLVSGSVGVYEEIGVDDDASITGGHVLGSVERETVGYRFNGDINYIDADGGVEVTILYDDDGEPTADRIEIISSKDGEVDYTFTVTDSVEKVTDNGDYSADEGDTIVENDDGTWTVDGSTANGYGDTYDFHGEIERFNPVEGDFTLFINGEETTVTELTGQEPPEEEEEETYPLTIDDFDGGTIREEWGNAENHATTDAFARVGSHSVYRTGGSSLYDDGTGFEDTFQEGGRFLGWSIFVDEVVDSRESTVRLGFNGDGEPGQATDYSEIWIHLDDNKFQLVNRESGVIDVDSVKNITVSTQEWYDLVAFWGHGVIEAWLYDSNSNEIGYVRSDTHDFFGDYWWLYDGQPGDDSLVIDNVRLYEEHPHTGRHYTDEPEPDFEKQDGDVVISPTGDDGVGDGSYESPYFSLGVAMTEVDGRNDTAGTRIICRGGVYQYDEQQNESGLGGTESDPIIIRPYGDESPVMDFSEGEDLSYGIRSWGGHDLHIKGLEVRNVPNSSAYDGSGMRFPGGENITIESCDVHSNNYHGIFFSHGATNNTVRRCALHNNTDNQTTNADGIAFVGGGTANNIVEYCLLYDNADDGYDCLDDGDFGNIVRYTAAWGHENAGFKARAGTTLHHCAAWDNQRGFGTYSAETKMTFHNCVAYDNSSQDFWFTSNAVDSGGDPHEVRNCISVTNNVDIETGAADVDFCTFDENENVLITERDMDIRSLDEDDFELWGEEGEFLRLSEGSLCINNGTVLDYEYENDAPDLGAYEYDLDSHDPL